MKDVIAACIVVLAPFLASLNLFLWYGKRNGGGNWYLYELGVKTVFYLYVVVIPLGTACITARLLTPTYQLVDMSTVTGFVFNALLGTILGLFVAHYLLSNRNSNGRPPPGAVVTFSYCVPASLASSQDTHPYRNSHFQRLPLEFLLQ